MERTIQVASVDPVANATRVSVNKTVAVTLSAPVDPATVTESSVRLEVGGQPVPVDRTLTSDNRTARLTPRDPLATFRQYTVRVTSGLTAADGGRLDQNASQTGYQEFSSRFTTVPESIPPMVTAVLPKDGASGVAVRPPIGVEFSKPILPASVNDETFLLRIVGGATVAGVRIVAADSMSASFQPTFDLSLSTEYEIEITNWVVDRFDVRLDQDPDTPDRQGFTSRFLTDHERIPPRVVAVSPADSAEGVSPDAEVRVDFDEPIAAASIAGVRVLDESMAAVPGQRTLGNGDIRVSFRPDEPWALLRRYTVVVDTTVTDRLGNRLDQDPKTEEREGFASTFLTEGDIVGPRVTLVDPADEATGIALDAPVRLAFSEPLDPATLAGISLQDSAGVELDHTTTLVAPDSVEMLASAPFEFDREYRVLVATTVADSAGNGLDQDPGTEPLDPFVSRFRTQVETFRPYVTAILYDAPMGNPPPITTRIRIAFSEPIEPSSLDPEDVDLTRGGVPVPLDASFPAPDTLLLVPVQPLSSDARYELVVTGLADLHGNPFDQFPDSDPLDAFETAFRTEADTVPPRVVSSDPAAGSEGVAVDPIVTVTFSEPMDSTTVETAHLQLVRIDGSQEFPVSGSIEPGPDLTVFTFVPENPLLRGFVHEIRADFFLEDLAGNPLDQDPDTPANEPFVASFLVGSRPVADGGGFVCDPADTSAVAVDASASFDPDGVIVNLLWRWGDGTETEIVNPDSAAFHQTHVYACSDIAGCDGVDNDGDGVLDEDDCDESYVITLRVRDDDGLTAADTVGVSFCGFVVRSSEPSAGAADVDTMLTEARLHLTREVDPAFLDTTHFQLLENGLDTGSVTTVTAGADAGEVVLTLDGLLTAGATYTFFVAATVLDPEGRVFDQDLCAPGRQPFTADFTTQSAPGRGGP
ncbi:MAG: Ig-like domain-containing protein [Candidatus Eisenbacteria bacterium]|uniref:Ig-like domain-containing protein n=1 Tax=Eiseniibacteriota bacterium TaxID=2212470 RepID=A0A956LXQ9_UNCEI|nr:Ig-like domain-containing protein [Candidatus Eisenbacteria bacterium]